MWILCRFSWSGETSACRIKDTPIRRQQGSRAGIQERGEEPPDVKCSDLEAAVSLKCTESNCVIPSHPSTMCKLVTWNVRGLGNPVKRQKMCDHLK
ncbi:uncharacterized protein LOC144753409 isoform X2 [Lissotriton helveticus]